MASGSAALWCMRRMLKVAALWNCWTFCQAHEATDTVICGGFVQSEYPIDYSKIEIRLLDKAGNLKFQAPCATNNGNYEVPVFGKKGEFILAISAPEGLAFEPSKVPVTIDGSTDPCSMQHNINFRFIGYSVLGKVNSKRSEEGPSGVVVKISDATAKLVHSVTTEKDGRFAIPSLLPGTYTLEASHPYLRMEKARSSVTIKDATVTVPAHSLVISGYPVNGNVRSSGEPISDVKFILFSRTVGKGDLKECELELENSTPKEHPQYGIQICETKSDPSGKFEFLLIPGAYAVIAIYKGGNTKYDIDPLYQEFTVQHEAFTIPKVFEVKGFTAVGTVFTSPKGSGVPSADIHLNGTFVTRTDKKGIYRLEKTETGWYKIEVKKDFYDFPTEYVKITPAEPKIAMIVARSFSVCGEITTLRPIDRILSFEAVHAQPHLSRDAVIRDNKFCILLESGEYKVSIFDAPQDKYQRLMFTPSEKVIQLKDFPITDLTFTQILGSVSGIVRCVVPCPNTLKISLLTGNGEAFSDMDTAGGFRFENVDLGTHMVKVVEPSKRFCWDLVQKTIELTTSKPTAVVGFKQTGFLFEVWSSHAAGIVYSLKGKAEKKQDQLKSGFTELCIPDAGEYEIETRSCHKFEQDLYTFNTDSPTRLSIHAIAHSTNISINTDDDQSPFKLRVKRTSDGSSSIFTPSGSPKTIALGSYQYTFLEYFPSDENLAFFPSSDALIFKPLQAELTVTDECDKNVVSLEAFKGVIISGHTVPPVPDVDIVLTTEAEVQRGKTDESGRYSLGPVPRSASQNISAEKRGYEFEMIHGTHDIKAIKLSEIKVITQDMENRPVQGVLISISGTAGLRMNNFTAETGAVSFLNVGHGDYIIRPMIKEFRFEPSSKSITLAQGHTAVVEWNGIRVAYSAFGKITSLGGEPEAGITVEAVSREPCPQMQEESVTGNNGLFRISGLKAGCVYTVRPKEGELNRVDIRWTSPANRTLQMGAEDVQGMNFLAFRGFNDAEFTGRIDTTKEFLSQLRVCLYRTERPDESLQCISFTISPMFEFTSVPLDSRSYILRIESSLSKKEYSYTNVELPIKANSTFRHFVLPFTATRRHSEPEIAPGTIWVLPLIILCTVIYFNRIQVLQAVQNLANTIKLYTRKSSSKDRKKAVGSVSANPQNSETSFDDHSSSRQTILKKRFKPVKP